MDYQSSLTLPSVEFYGLRNAVLELHIKSPEFQKLLNEMKYDT